MTIATQFKIDGFSEETPEMRYSKLLREIQNGQPFRPTEIASKHRVTSTITAALQAIGVVEKSNKGFRAVENTIPEDPAELKKLVGILSDELKKRRRISNQRTNSRKGMVSLDQAIARIKAETTERIIITIEINPEI